MLKLPTDWRSIHGGAVALDLLAQLPTRALQTEFLHHLISASLELMLTALRTRRDLACSVETLAKCSWRIRDFRFVYFPAVDDDALNWCTRSESKMPECTVIVPSNHESVLRHALIDVLQGRSPMVFSIDSFISLRIFFSSGDAGWSHKQTMLKLLSDCNQHIAEANLDDLRVKIPPDLL